MGSNMPYDILVIGGGISGCVFVSKYLKNNPQKKAALVEVGRGLGGRSSTRISRRFEGWELNHGSPSFNILNSKNSNLLDNYINELLVNKLITIDDSDLVQLDKANNPEIKNASEFSCGKKYISTFSMSQLSLNILNSTNLRSQIDFYFETLIVDLKFNNNEWKITSINGNEFRSKYLVCSSNLLLHKRSLSIMDIDEVPLRKAIPPNKNKKIDLLLKGLDKQSFIPRLSFLIYTNENYNYKDFYPKKNRYFY